MQRLKRILETWMAGAVLTLLVSSIAPAPVFAAPPTPPAPESFDARLESYLALHRKLEGTLPKLSKEATPEEIDKNQRALGAMIQSARKGAKQGEFFDHAMQARVRQTLVPLFKGPEGPALKASVMDENPSLPKLAVNARYPDDVPLSTMPPDVLSALPKLDEDMEYRFVGDHLILLDAHAHLIVDFMDDVWP